LGPLTIVLYIGKAVAATLARLYAHRSQVVFLAQQTGA
jgi:hypothetical protein